MCNITVIYLPTSPILTVVTKYSASCKLKLVMGRYTDTDTDIAIFKNTDTDTDVGI